MSTDVGRLLLLGNYLPDEQRSMLRFENELRDGLVAGGVDVGVIRPPQIVGGRGRRPSKWLKYVDIYLLAPFVLGWRARSADVVHIVDHSNAIYRWFVPRPCLVTCHDLLAVRSALDEFERTPIGRLGRVQQWCIARSLRRADHVTCVSEVTRGDLVTVLGCDKGATSVVPVCLAEAFGATFEQTRTDGDSAPADPGGDEPFWLHVGSDAWYKNRVEAIRIFAELRKELPRASLVLVGPPLSAYQAQVATELDVVDAVRVVEGVSDRELDRLYSRSLGLLFPSVAEGFGWPVIEAQAAGCPVFVSEIDILAEVAGSGAVAFRLGDVPAAGRVILDALSRRDAMIAAGGVNAARFSRRDMTDGYLTLYVRIRDEARRAATSVRRGLGRQRREGAA